jgi:hypothetical protein
VEHHQGVAGEGARAARLGKYEYERLRIKINYSDYFLHTKGSMPSCNKILIMWHW